MPIWPRNLNLDRDFTKLHSGTMPFRAEINTKIDAEFNSASICRCCTAWYAFCHPFQISTCSMTAQLAATWSGRTMQGNLSVVEPAATVFRRAVDRLHGVMTVEDALASLRLQGSCMLVFWSLACWVRQPRQQVDPTTLLTSLLSSSPSRLATSVLRNAFALLSLFRQCYHPRATLVQAT